MPIDLSHLKPDTLLGSLVRLPLRLVPRNLVVPILHGPIRGCRWITGAANHGAWLGTYEAAKAAKFAEALRPASVVFDLGAHVGYYTLIAAKRAHQGRVFAFEPFEPNRIILERHLQLNHVSNVTVLSSAVGANEHEARFASGLTTSMGHVSDEGELTVHIVSLDSLCGEGRLSPPDIMKIDIEGAEYDALLGSTEIITRAHPSMFLATHGSEVHAKCCEFLRDHGYQLESLDGVPLERSSEVLAVWRNRA